jgi:hypothetical protein
VVENSSSAGLSIFSPDANNSSIYFGSPSDIKGAEIAWGYSGDQLLIGTSKTGAVMVFRSGNQSEAMRIDSAGDVTVSTGNLVIGTHGKGIDFSANTDDYGTPASGAEVLDDYEEGTWTPVITFGGANVGMAATNTGKYTKIGNTVTVTTAISISTKGSSTGNAVISGLPFGPTTTVGWHINAWAVSFADRMWGASGGGVTTITLYEGTNAGVRTNLVETNFSNGSQMEMNITYLV